MTVLSAIGLVLMCLAWIFLTFTVFRILFKAVDKFESWYKRRTCPPKAAINIAAATVIGLEVYLLTEDGPDGRLFKVRAVYLRRKDAQDRANELEWERHRYKLVVYKEAITDGKIVFNSPDERDYRVFNVQGIALHLTGEVGDAV